MPNKLIKHQSDNPKMGTSKGYADGGKVLPAAKMDGGVFYRAAQKAGLRTDNATLNQIVALVNQGYPVDKATQMVAEQKQGKGFAAGGLVDERTNAERPAVKGKPVSVGADPNIKQKPIKAGRLFS